MTENRKDCPMRHENGNCTVAGGFCTAVNDPICEALHNAFECGYRSALRVQQEPNDWICTLKCTALMEEGMCSHGGLCCLHESQRIIQEKEPLTLDELRKMGGEPVWIKLFDKDEEFWVLRYDWVDTRNPDPMILLHMRWYSHADYGKTWLAYRKKPEEGTV